MGFCCKYTKFPIGKTSNNIKLNAGIITEKLQESKEFYSKVLPKYNNDGRTLLINRIVAKNYALNLKAQLSTGAFA